MYNNAARLDQALLHRRWGGDSEGLSLEQGLRVGDCRTRTQSPWWRFYFITWLPLLFKGKSWESSVHELCHPPHMLLRDPPACSWSLSPAVIRSLAMVNAGYLWAGSRVNIIHQERAEKNTLCKSDRFTQREDRKRCSSSSNYLMVFSPNHT